MNDQAVADFLAMQKFEKAASTVTDDSLKSCEEQGSDDEDEAMIIAEDDKEACDEIYRLVKSSLKFSNKKLYYKHQNIWIHDEPMIKSMLNVFVSEAGIMRPSSKILKGEGIDLVSYTAKRGVSINIANGVIDLATRNFDDAWTSKLFSSSLGKILFDNGYWDFKASEFHETGSEAFDTSIIFVEKIPYKFRHIDTMSESELDYINSIKKRLFYDPFGEKVGDYYCLKIARGLAGDCQKNFMVCVGPTNTGKSLITGAIRSSIGGYFGAFNGGNMKYKAIENNDAAQALRWMMFLQSKRIIASNELPMGFPLDANMMKKCSSGGVDSITARCHGGNETDFQVGFLPILFANDINDIKPADDALLERVKCIPYTRVCVENPQNEFEMKKDENLLQVEIYTDKFKMGFVWLMLNAYKHFHEFSGRRECEPEGVAAAKKETLGESGENIIEKFLKDFEITQVETDFVKSSAIKKWLEGTQISITKFGLEMNKHAKLKSLKNVHSKDKKIGTKTIKVWFGIKEAEEDSEK